MTDFLLLALGLIVTMLGYFLTQLSRGIKELEHTMTACQTNMPMDYVLKVDYKSEMGEIKNILKDIQVILREQNGKASK